ncbi:MAG: Uma2 family endonuclease [Bacteroidetes bacterium]|nr:Uma2 family endonuclease [Bacteroidota bacterium]
MSVAAAIVHPSERKPAMAQKARRVSWPEFEKRYLTREDGYKYEWTDGQVEKTKSTMNQTQLFVWHNLSRLLWKLSQTDKTIGSLSAETDTFLSDKIHRRPDMAYFSIAQMKAAVGGKPQIPAFVVEVISPNDNINRVNRKVSEYFDAGVSVLWHIFPELKEVYVFESGQRATICRDDDVCTAEKAIPGFSITANDIFREP